MVDMNAQDLFASASMDGTARIWDLRTTDCQGVLRLDVQGHRPSVAFDPQGLVFAAATGSGQLKLFDLRGYDKGPFTTFKPDLGNSTGLSCMKFSNDGKLMLLSTTSGKIALLDAFTGNLEKTFAGHKNEQGMPLEACFTPDANFVLSGSEDGAIWRWDVKTGTHAVLREHSAPVTAIKCNPTRQMLASACMSLCLWLPP